MGKTCSKDRNEGQKPDPLTGLTKEDIRHIKGMWFSIVIKSTFKEIGTAFFIQLFEVYPYMKKYFPDYNGRKTQDLKNSASLRAHGISVFTAITSYVDCINDPTTLVALIHKRTHFHYHRGITFEDMENLKQVLLEFLKQNSAGYRYPDEGLAAWEKLLTVHNAVYKAKIEELHTEYPESEYSHHSEVDNQLDNK